MGGSPLVFSDPFGLQSPGACAASPANAAVCADSGLINLQRVRDITKILATAKTTSELCDKCPATKTRSQAEREAHDWAGTSARGNDPDLTAIPWGQGGVNLPGGNSFKGSKVWASFQRQYFAPFGGWQGSKKGGRLVQEHAFGHPDLSGGKNHECPHFYARNDNGDETEIPYKPGSP